MNRLLILVLAAPCGVAQAADSPAQAGYCVQHLRSMLSMINNEQIDAKLRPILNQWSAYGLSFPTDSQASWEFLRGVSQANSDLAYVKSKVAAQSSECKQQAAAPLGDDALAACLKEKQKADEGDPTLTGIHTRTAPCLRGPSL